MATTGFNNKPASTTVRTASYTIPAGRYARVVANVQAGGTFTIGGVVALSSIALSWSVLASSPLAQNASNGAGSLLTTTSGGGSGAFASTTAFMQTSACEYFWVPAGTVLSGAGTWRMTVEEYIG